MENRKQPLPYFMAYSLPDGNETPMSPPADKDYFRQMYPMIVKRYIRIIVDILDQMDVEDSYIYDEFPDGVRLERLSQVILELIPLENNMTRETQHNLVRVLLFEEIIRRRNYQSRDRRES